MVDGDHGRGVSDVRGAREGLEQWGCSFGVAMARWSSWSDPMVEAMREEMDRRKKFQWREALSRIKGHERDLSEEVASTLGGGGQRRWQQPSMVGLSDGWRVSWMEGGRKPWRRDT